VLNSKCKANTKNKSRSFTKTRSVVKQVTKKTNNYWSH